MLKRLRNLEENSRIVINNVIGAFAVKGLSIIVSFITVPIFIRYFNNDIVLGIWYTLLSMLMWFLNFDLGIGNGIRNNLVTALAKKDVIEAKKVISSGFVAIGVITCILSLVGIVFISTLNLNNLFNVNPEIISPKILVLSTVYVFVAVMLRFFLTTISSLFYALQKSAINNLLALIVSILQLVFILVSKYESPEEALLGVSLAYIFLSNLPVVIAGVLVFCRSLKECRPSLAYVDKSHIKAIMNVGSLFFLCQILYMIIANTNEFFITNLYGANYTMEYTFYYKIATIGIMVISLALTPVWSAVTKAQAEKNWQWLIKLYKYIKLGGIGILIIQLLTVPIIPYCMDIWLGKDVIEVSSMTSLSFALYGAIFTYAGMLSTIANGLAQMKAQTISYSIAIFLKILLLFLLAPVTSWDFIMWVNIVILLPYIIIQQRSLNRFLVLQLS